MLKLICYLNFRGASLSLLGPELASSKIENLFGIGSAASWHRFFWDQSWRLSKRKSIWDCSAASWQVTYCMEYAETHSLLTFRGAFLSLLGSELHGVF
jgi:hypothetical protein